MRHTVVQRGSVLLSQFDMVWHQIFVILRWCFWFGKVSVILSGFGVDSAWFRAASLVQQSSVWLGQVRRGSAWFGVVRWCCVGNSDLAYFFKVEVVPRRSEWFWQIFENCLVLECRGVFSKDCSSIVKIDAVFEIHIGQLWFGVVRWWFGIIRINSARFCRDSDW